MRGLYIPVEGMPKQIDIDDEDVTHDLQHLVGSPLGLLAVLKEGLDIWCDDNGIATKEPNRAIFATKEMEEEGYLSQMDYQHVSKEGELYTIIYGDVVALGVDVETGSSRSLTDDELAFAEDYFTRISPPYSGLEAALACGLEAALARMAEAEEPSYVEEER